MIDPARAPSLLLELDSALALEGAEPVEWIICGGTALAILQLLKRATVDVLSGWTSTAPHIVPLSRFESAVERAIDGVAQDHPELRTKSTRWVNLGLSGLLTFGLPRGCTDRLHRVCVGAHLALHLPARADLIAFKLLAAVDAAHSRRVVHKSDFASLRPSETELKLTVDWVLTVPDHNHHIRAELREFLHELGHDDLAYYIA